MKENIETKDVQRTEYLDKNGLDMLWAKVKENTQNQVEVERDRATTQENRIIDTKADKSELHSSYVSNSTFTALQEKVAANTDAISDKQDAGNYLHYKTLNNEGYYEIPAIRIPNSGGNNKTDIDSQSISVNCSYPDSHTTITCDGISNTDNNANHVYATDGSIADLTQYAKKSEITAGGNVDDVQVNGVTVVENKIANIKPATKESLGVVKVGDGLNVTDDTISVDTTAIAALEAKVTDNTAAITNINVSKGIPYDASVTDKYQTDKDFSVKNSNGATADFGPNNGIRLSNENFAFGVNTTDCIKFSVQNGTTYSKITPFGLESKVNDETYINCSSDSFLEIKNRENRISLQPAQFLVENGHITILMNQEQILIKNIVDNTQAMLTPYQLLMKEDDSQVILNSNGVSLPNGDNNHVLTSNASTIDITQYVLKSVYDEKIAALEARIAALEAKHTETA